MTGSWKNASGVLECRGPRSVAVRPTPTQQLVKSGDRKTAGCRLNIFLRRLRCHWHDRLEQPTDGRGHYTTCCGRLLLLLLLLSKHLDVTDDSMQRLAARPSRLTMVVLMVSAMFTYFVELPSTEHPDSGPHCLSPIPNSQTLV